MKNPYIQYILHFAISQYYKHSLWWICSIICKNKLVETCVSASTKFFLYSVYFIKCIGFLAINHFKDKHWSLLIHWVIPNTLYIILGYYYINECSSETRKWLLNNVIFAARMLLGFLVTPHPANRNKSICGTADALFFFFSHPFSALHVQMEGKKKKNICAHFFFHLLLVLVPFDTDMNASSISPCVNPVE